MSENPEVVAAEDRKRQDATDFDGTWKGTIQEFTDDVIYRLLPGLYEQLDHTGKIEFLSTEFIKIEEPQEPAVFVDSLIKVPLKDGSSEFVLLHIEVQGSGTLAKVSVRMLEYGLQIRKQYGRVPVGLLIMTSATETCETGIQEWKEQFLGVGLSYKFHCVNLNGLDDEELLKSERLGDLILYAIKAAVRINHCERNRLRRKHPENDPKGDYLKAEAFKELIRVLNNREWDQYKIGLALNLMLRVFNLSDEWQEKVNMELKEEGADMQEYQTIWHKKGRTEGHAEGLIEGRNEGYHKAAVQMLGHDFTPEVVSVTLNLPLTEVQALDRRRLAGEFPMT